MIKQGDLKHYKSQKMFSKKAYKLLNHLREFAKKPYKLDFSLDLSDHNIGLSYAMKLLEQSKVGAEDLNDRVSILAKRVTEQANKKVRDDKYENMLIETAQVWLDYLK